MHGIVVVPNAAPPRARGGRGARRPRRPPPGATWVEVLYLGGFANPAKGGHVLVEALPELLAAAPRVSVTMAGLGPAPDLRDTAGRADGSAGSSANAAGAALADADIVVLPSISEGLPVVLLEALSQGRAVVAARAAGSRR